MNTVPTIVCVAGFADNGAMFAPLVEARRPDDPTIRPVNLPGFSAPPAPNTSIAELAAFVRDAASKVGARTVVAHSVASVVAAEAAHLPGGMIERIVSLEGNLTAKDAYFSGTAADYADPLAFRTAFLARLDELGADDLIVRGYRSRAATADAGAMWRLGCDARAYSDRHHPGERLQSAASVTYVLNRANCAAVSLGWLDASDLATHELPGASHWPTIDRTEDVLSILRATTRAT